MSGFVTPPAESRSRCALRAMALAALVSSGSGAPLGDLPSATYSVDAFGATPDAPFDDDTPGIQAAIDAAVHFANVSGQPVTVLFGGGSEYRLRSGKRGLGHLDLSCADGAGRVTLRGQGATIVAQTPRLGLFYAKGSRSLTVEDLNVDLAVRPFLACTVTSVNDEARVVTAQPMDDATPLKSFPGYSEEWGWVHDSDVLHRPKAGAGSSFGAVSRVQDEATGAVTFQMREGTRMGDFAEGDVLSYHYRRGNNFRFQDCEDIELQRVTSYGSGLFFVSTSHVSGLSVTACSVLVKPGLIQATNGDGVHLKYCRDVEIRDCYFEGLSDDAVNVTGTVGFTIEGSTFANKRRHAITFDTDVAKYRSRNGRILHCVAFGNGGSFLHHDGGDYSSVDVVANRGWGNNRTASAAQVDRHVGLRIAGTDRRLAWGQRGAVGSPDAGAIGAWDGGDVWSLLRIPTPKGARCRLMPAAIVWPHPWLYLTAPEAGSAANQKVDAEAEPEGPTVALSLRTEPRLDPKHAQVDGQLWIQEHLPDGSFRLRHALSGRYLSEGAGGARSLALVEQVERAARLRIVSATRR